MIREVMFRYAGKLLLSHGSAWSVAVGLVAVLGFFDIGDSWMSEFAFAVALALLAEREQDRIKAKLEADDG